MKPENRELLIRAEGMIESFYHVAKDEGQKTAFETILTYIDTVIDSEVKK